MSKSLLVVLAIVAFLWMPLSRAADSPSIAGKWRFVFDTHAGDRPFDAIFEQNADKVTGKWAVSESKKDGDAIAGTYADNKLVLEFPASPEEVGPGTMKINGKLEDDGSLTGTWSFLDYSGTFKATRVKD